MALKNSKNFFIIIEFCGLQKLARQRIDSEKVFKRIEAGLIKFSYSEEIGIY
jgi:hypothetical protein